MELFEQFVKERRYLKNVSPATEQWYKYSWKALGPYLEPSFTAGNNGNSSSAIKATLLRGIEALGASNSVISINTHLRCIQVFLNWCHEGGHLRQPVKVGRLKEEQRILATFAAQHIKRLIAWKPRSFGQQRLFALVFLLLDTGPRIEESLGLRREDIDLDSPFIRAAGKGGKHRLVPISLELRKALFRWLSKHNHILVFATRHGTKLKQRNLLRDFKVLGECVGSA